MRGIKRIIIFFTLTTILPSALIIIPLYLRHIFYADVAYAATESDIMEINDGISTIFCEVRIYLISNIFVSMSTDTNYY
jgi:hypothetical protein